MMICVVSYYQAKSIKTIRIYHESEGRIEKIVPRIAVWHYEACREFTNVAPNVRIFLSYPHRNNGFVFLLTIVFIKDLGQS